jgi:hypothetical protein
MQKEKLIHVQNTLRTQLDVPWDVDSETTFDDSNPLGMLVMSFANPQHDAIAFRTLSWLTFYAARRVLPCWEQCSDDPWPISAVKILSQWNNKGDNKSDLTPLINPPLPTFRGRVIVDCRACDTTCAVKGISAAASFSLQRDPKFAMISLGFVDLAFDQSSLGLQDHFRKWFIDVAIPGSLNLRDLSLEEQNAYRTYDPNLVRFSRG